MRIFLPLCLSLILHSYANAQVLPTNAVVAGTTIGEWSAKWWQWAFSIPTNQNPGFDTDGSRAGVGQSGPVFFLAGALSFSGTATRAFTVPEGRYLFFPIVNVYADNIDVVPAQTVEELRDATRGFIDLTTDLQLAIDGTSVTNLFEHRAASPVFSFDFSTSDNVVTILLGHSFSGLDDPIISDGYWVMIEPLSVGSHTVKFGGTIGPPVNFTININDTITVIPTPLPQRLEELIALIGESNLSASRQRLLLVNLRRAEKWFEREHVRTGIAHLRLFQSKVRHSLRNTPVLKDEFIHAAQRIIDKANDPLSQPPTRNNRRKETQ